MPRLLLGLTIILAAAARAALLFSTEWVPGINGAYYLVQARSLLEKGALAIPDLPLVFFLHATLAAIIDVLTPLSQSDAVIWAVKLGDSILPALGVLPVFALALRWAPSSRLNNTLIFLAALLVPASFLALTMVGDFQKNSLGIVLLCALVWALFEWMNRHGRWRAAVVVGLLGLIGITHIGVFGSALLLVAATLLVFAAARGRHGFIKIARLSAVAVPVAILAGAVVFWGFDPSRIQKLIQAISEPAEFLRSGPNPGGMNPPGGFNWFSFAAFALAVLPGVVVGWRRRKELTPGMTASITGVALTVILLTGPWITGDKLFRLQMNATPLAVLCLLFAVLQIRMIWVRASVGLVIFGLLLTPSVFRIQAGGHPMITPQAHEELRELVSFVAEPERTLIVARHGLEWWTAWTLHTHIAQAQALEAEDWTRYVAVYFLEDKRGGMPGFGPPVRDGLNRPGGERWFDPFIRLVGGDRPPKMRPGFPPGRGPPFGRPPGGPQGPRGGRPPMGMMGVPIPKNATILHDGEHFRLGRVQEPPEFVRNPQPQPD